MSKVNAGLQSFKAKSGKSKRMRTSFTSEQLSRLEKEFARQQYMVGSERFLLASALNLTEAQVTHQQDDDAPACFASPLMAVFFSSLRSKFGSRIDASSGANRASNSSRPNWPSWVWLLH